MKGIKEGEVLNKRTHPRTHHRPKSPRLPRIQRDAKRHEQEHEATGHFNHKGLRNRHRRLRRVLEEAAPTVERRGEGVAVEGAADEAAGEGTAGELRCHVDGCAR